MNAQLLPAPTDQIGTIEDLYANIDTSSLADLFYSYNAELASIYKVSALMNDPGNAKAIPHFFSHFTESYRFGNVQNVFDKSKAIPSLNAEYWQVAMNRTDIRDVMPKARKDQWNEMIRKAETPEFTPENVIPTFQDLLSSRLKFFAEKVEGIFKSLSREHVTNSPYGFGKKMIVSYAVDRWGMVNHSMADYIHDLRTVIAQLITGKAEVGLSTYGILCELLPHTGLWHEIDGGAIRIKIFKKGTAHIEVHPDMAWRLNQALATLYPAAIPSKHRSPNLNAKRYTPIRECLSPKILKCLNEVSSYKGALHITTKNTYGSETRKKVGEILRLIGCTPGRNNVYSFQDDYDPMPIIKSITTSGTIPEFSSHQFYETNENLVSEVESRLDIQPGDECLEPSAGRGALAAIADKATVRCIDISPLFCKILKHKGYENVECLDFIDYVQRYPNKRFDKIAMNPPFTKGQAKAHIQLAASLLKSNGRLVGIVPSTLNNNLTMPGFTLNWSAVLTDEFDGTSVSVRIVTIERG